MPDPARPKPVRVVFLGGLGEIGRNCACIEVDGRIVVLDCGIMFPDPDMPGIDLVLPEFTYLHERADRVDGIVLTHGHEDHTGGLAYLLRELHAPIYGSELTVGLARHRIDEAGLADRTRVVVVADGERVRIGACDVEFIPVTHSVPESMAIAFHTPQGVILHSGDFKLDLQPVDGRRTDLARMGELAQTEGIRLLLADSTNAEEPGFTESESSVGVVLRRVFAAQSGKRVIVACFASHMHRVQQIIDAAVANGRKVATLGRSMGKNVELGMRLGIISIPDGVQVDIEDVDSLPPGEVCVISTGSQGEPMSAAPAPISAAHAGSSPHKYHWHQPTSTSPSATMSGWTACSPATLRRRSSASSSTDEPARYQRATCGADSHQVTRGRSSARIGRRVSTSLAPRTRRRRTTRHG